MVVYGQHKMNLCFFQHCFENINFELNQRSVTSANELHGPSSLSCCEQKSEIGEWLTLCLIIHCSWGLSPPMNHAVRRMNFYFCWLQGDSGGPLQCGKGGQYMLIGIVSWGSSNCDPAAPTVFTRISAYTDWITSITGEAGSLEEQPGGTVITSGKGNR